jgi:hypothetical protein
MVDVQVCVHDEIHVVGARAGTREFREEPRACARHERARLRPKPGVDEHCRPASPDQNGTDREPPLLAAAQRGERFGEGREASLGVDKDRDVERANSQSGSGFRPPNPSSARCQ